MADPAPPPQLVRLRVLDGANVFVDGPCVGMLVDWGPPPWPDRPAMAGHLALLAGHPAMAAALPPGVAEVTSEEGLGRALAWIADGLQRTAGHVLPAPRSPVAPGRPGFVAIPIREIELGRQAAVAAFDLAAAIFDPADARAATMRDVLDRFTHNAALLALPTNELRLVAAAEQRGIPWRRLFPDHPMLVFGQGARQMRALHNYSPATSHTATHLATRKDLTIALLRQHGLPVPTHRRVHTLEAAVRAAEAIGWPVVVKPVAADRGTGITIGVRNRADMETAYAAAARHGRVLVEEQIPGDHTRLTVIYGRCVCGMRLDPAHVVGDGTSSVATLIAAVNARRGDVIAVAYKKIAIDDEALLVLGLQGLSLDDVPPAGRKVVLRHVSNVSRGGTATNVTAAVHPDNARLAEQAARIVGLDVAGVDLITPDITRSFREVGGAICELNPTPAFPMREPTYAVEDAFLDGWFGGGADGRVPILCVLDDEAAARDAFARVGSRVPGTAFAAHGVARVGDWDASPPGASTADLTRMVLADPATRAVVVGAGSRGVVESGFGFDRCTVAVADDPPEGDVVRRMAAGLLGHVAARVVRPRDTVGLAAAIDRIAAAAD
ncbi:MAG: ATP-grasp domain-containing protein [Alphaproteobacteria bacterium]